MKINCNLYIRNPSAEISTALTLAVGIFLMAYVATAAAATTTTSNNTAMANNITALSSSSSGLKFSPQPVWEEQITDTGNTPINETHIIGTFTGNGTLNLPNSPEEAINITSNGNVIASIIDRIGVGEEVISTVDGIESATQKFFGIARFMEDGTGRAIVIALVDTNSTGKLAPLDGMILVGTHEQGPNIPTATDTIFRYWEWESGIPLPTDTITTTVTTNSEELPPQMDDAITSTTTTNATTATDDTNATAVEHLPPEEEEEVIEEQDKQATPTTAPAPLSE